MTISKNFKQSMHTKVFSNQIDYNMRCIKQRRGDGQREMEKRPCGTLFAIAQMDDILIY